jgi:multicomponent K+:H+ antiporter subunit G
MSPLAEAAVSALLVIGGVFLLVGSFALVKLPETMQRLHGPTKSTTLGVGGILVASMLYFLLGQGEASFHELLITLFLFLTAPISANLVAKAYLRKNGGATVASDEPETDP